jgi:hypothetical protein
MQTDKPESDFEAMLHELAEQSHQPENESHEIPYAVMPDQTESIRKTPPRKYTSPIAREGQKTGYAVSGFVFFIILSFLLASSHSVMQAYPASKSFFGLFGLNMNIPGENLVFDKMSAEIEGDVVRVTGNIVNLSKTQRLIPMIEASIKGAADTELAKWYIEPPKTSIDAEESLEFGSVTPSMPAVTGKEAGNILVRFVLNPKIGEASGDSNQALPEGAQTHPSDHAEGAGSPQHASSAPHQESSHPPDPEGHPSSPDPHTDAQEDHTSSHH